MMSPQDRLAYMANQIARNLAAQGEDAAILAVADHIEAFWDPRMKRQLFAGGGAGLEPIAARATQLLGERGAPSPQTLATRFADSGSDAG